MKRAEDHKVMTPRKRQPRRITAEDVRSWATWQPLSADQETLLAQMEREERETQQRKGK